MPLATPFPGPNSISPPSPQSPPSSGLNDPLDEAPKLAFLASLPLTASKEAKRAKCLSLAPRWVSLSLLTDVPHAAD